MKLRKPVTVTRRGQGQYNATTGLYEPAVTTTLTIQASVQPSLSSDTQRLPEGRRQGGSVTLYTNDRLNTPTENGQQGDVIHFNGALYEVLSEADWQNNVLSHYQYIAGRVL